MEERTLIFTYGTLKRGFQNHYLMESNNGTFISTCTTSLPHPVVIGPFGLSFLIKLPGSGRRVTGELYSVTAEALPILDQLEGVDRGHYERLPIKVKIRNGDDEEKEEEREVMAYYAHREYGERLWKKCGEEKAIAEYTMREAADYVRIKDRRKDRTFLDEIRFFIGDSNSN